MRFKVGDRVLILAGMMINRTGRIERAWTSSDEPDGMAYGYQWFVRFENGSHAGYSDTHLAPAEDYERHCPGCEGTGVHSCEGSHAAREQRRTMSAATVAQQEPRSQEAVNAMVYRRSPLMDLVPKAPMRDVHEIWHYKSDGTEEHEVRVLEDDGGIAPCDPRPPYEPPNISDEDRAHWESIVIRHAATAIVEASIPNSDVEGQTMKYIRALWDSFDSARAQLTAATQRASKLADDAGHLQARLDASEGNVVAANAKVADLESDLRGARRTIAALRDQIIKLGARPL